MKLSTINHHLSTHRGFTLLELVIVVVIIAILAVVGLGYFRNVVKSNEIELSAKSIASALIDVRSRAIAAENNMKWGIHFVNDAAGDYYEVFYTPTDYNDASKVIVDKVYLPQGVELTDVATTADIIFNKITGIPTVSRRKVWGMRQSGQIPSHHSG